MAYLIKSNFALFHWCTRTSVFVTTIFVKSFTHWLWQSIYLTSIAIHCLFDQKHYNMAFSLFATYTFWYVRFSHFHVIKVLSDEWACFFKLKRLMKLTKMRDLCNYIRDRIDLLTLTSALWNKKNCFIFQQFNSVCGEWGVCVRACVEKESG
jgi:hypothetical protein